MFLKQWPLTKNLLKHFKTYLNAKCLFPAFVFLENLNGSLWLLQGSIQ